LWYVSDTTQVTCYMAELSLTLAIPRMLTLLVTVLDAWCYCGSKYRRKMVQEILKWR